VPVVHIGCRDVARGLVLGPVSVLVLAAIDFSGLTRGEFALYKAVLGVVLGAIVTPVIAVCGMADAPERRRHDAT